MTEQTYHTHFNGGRPYKVVLRDDPVEGGEGINTVVNIYEQKDGEPYGPSITRVNVSKYFIGKSTGDDTFVNADHYTYDAGLFDGNTILLETGENAYMLIRDEIVEFNTEEPISHFWSCIGRNDVPYPVASSENYIYFLLSDDMTYVPKDMYHDEEGEEGEEEGEEDTDDETEKDSNIEGETENYEFAYRIYYNSQKLRDEAVDL